MHTVRSTINVKKCVFPVLLIAALSPRIAAAALGEPETSVQTETARLHASLTVSEHAGYRLHELQLTSGTLVREFAGSDGKVFAVAWSGPTVPNLREILGQYFDSYVTAAKAPHSGHLFVFRGKRAQPSTFCIPFSFCDDRVSLASIVWTNVAGLAVPSRQGPDVHLRERAA